MLLAVPQPYDFHASTERFRAYGPDRASVWHDGGLHRVVGGRELRIVSPVNGVVAEVNGSLAKRPGLINSDPYGYGWAVSLEPAGGTDIPLPADETAVEWMKKDLIRLRAFIEKYRGGEALRNMLRGANDIAWGMFQDGFLTGKTEKEA